MARSDRHEVMMIGIDAGDIDYIQASLGQLPNLRRLFSDGALSRLRSPAEIMTASVWPTFYTGKLPGEHGYYFPMQWDPNTMRLRRVSADWLYCEPFWYEFARQGLLVTALDVQTAFPSRIPCGVEVINWGAQSFESLSSNRPELARDILRRFGKHPMGPDIPVRQSRGRLEAMRKDLLAGVRQRGDLCRWLLQQTEWRLFITVFTEGHRAGHYFWPDPSPAVEVPENALVEVFQAIDKEIGSLVASVDMNDTVVILFAVHGMGPNDAQSHFVPEIMDRINAAFAAEGRAGARPARQRSPMRVLRESLPPGVQEFVARSVPEGVRDWVTSRAFGGGLAWDRTPGFAIPSGGEAFIRCNLAGREKEGMLPEGSELHRSYLERVKQGFLSLKVKGTDIPLVKEVVFPGDVYAGPRSHHLPDVAVVWNGLKPAKEIYSERLGAFSGQLATGRPGNHRADGFAVVVDRRSGATDPRRLDHIVDLAPFVRHLLTGSEPM